MDASSTIGANLHYKKLGETGETIIILHGLFGMHDNWFSFAKELAENHVVYLIDQRNHGKSPKAERFDYPTLAQDLYDFMTYHGVTRAHLVGHSMGGKTVMQFCSAYAHMCESVTVVDIAPKQYEKSHVEIFQAVLSLDLSQVSKRSDADKMLAEKITSMPVRQFLLKNLTRSSGGYQWKAHFQALYDAYEDILAECKFENNSVPTLFVQGTQSRYLNAHDREALQAYGSHIHWARIEAGHWVHAEAPDKLRSALEKFWNSIL